MPPSLSYGGGRADCSHPRPARLNQSHFELGWGPAWPWLPGEIPMKPRHADWRASGSRSQEMAGYLISLKCRER